MNGDSGASGVVSGAAGTNGRPNRYGRWLVIAALIVVALVVVALVT